MRTLETWLAAKIIALDINRAIDKAERLPYSYEREVIVRKLSSARDMLLYLSKRMAGGGSDGR